ncbi:MAG: NAD(P)-dependent oxidoreductase [Desulfurococcales archaeon]|nr:NAD(P)-dependent oxidoreductase [Desulfurococcales archaeon]
MNGHSVLITGASGMLGLHVVERFLSRGWNVVSLVNPGSLSRRPWAREVLRETEVVEASITDRDRLRNVLDGLDFDVVVHIVAVLGRGRREMSVNYGGTVNLLGSLRDVGVFVFVSAILALGDSLRFDASEEAGCRPRTWYEMSKCESEKVVMARSRMRGWHWVIVRPVWMYGRYTRNPDIPRLLRLAKHGVGLVLGRRNLPLGLVSAEDVADAILFLYESGGEGVYNVRGPRMYSAEELAKALLRAARGSDSGKMIRVPEWILSLGSRFVGALRYVELAPRDVPIDKLSRLGWRPRVDLWEGLPVVAGWMRDNGML